MAIKKEDKLLIKVQDLDWKYEKDKSFLLKKLNLNLYEWEFHILTWKSWSWKSTLAKLLSGHYNIPPKSIYHKMEDMFRYTKTDIQKYRQKVWLVYQKEHLINTLTIKENIIYPLNMLNYSAPEIEKAYEKVIKHFHIKSLEKKAVNSLSEWEKQMIAFVRAIIHSPEFVILDEPTWNLDTKSMQHLSDLIIQSNIDWNTIILFTHDEYLISYIESKLKSVIITKL